MYLLFKNAEFSLVMLVFVVASDPPPPKKKKKKKQYQAEGWHLFFENDVLF